MKLYSICRRLSKDNIEEIDIIKVIADIQLMDDKHGAFWALVITDDENVIEVNKDLSLSVIFVGQQTNYKPKDWNEVTDLYKLLLIAKFDKIAEIVSSS